MAADDRGVSRLAVCSAVFAGFAYLSYSVVRNAFCRRRARNHRKIGEDDDEKVALDLGSMKNFRHFRNATSQTDIFLGTLDHSDHSNTASGIVRPLSVQERVRELNLKSRNNPSNGPFSFMLHNSPFNKTRSLQNSPFSTPRLLSPVDVHHYLSRSAENLIPTPPSSPVFRRSLSRRSLPRTPSYLDNDHNEQKVSEVHILLKDSEDTLRQRLESLHNQSRVLTPFEAQSLVSLLYSKDEALLVRTLTTVTNCAAFSVNQDYLREANCLHMLRTLLSDTSLSPAIRMAVIQAIGNLALNKDNMEDLHLCIPVLMDMVDSYYHLMVTAALSGIEESILIPTLITLTNLAVLTDWHHHFPTMLNTLHQMLSKTGGSSKAQSALQLQTCKLLVNLSCNVDMVPYILSAQAPTSLHRLLDQNYQDSEFLIRFTAVLDNIVTTVQKYDLNVSRLPMEGKAASPETFFSALYGLVGRERIRSKLLSLSHHSNEDIRVHAKRVYEVLDD